MRVRAASPAAGRDSGRVQRWVLFGSPGPVRAALMRTEPRPASDAERELHGLTFYDRSGHARLDIELRELSGAAVPIIALSNAPGHRSFMLGLDCGGGNAPGLWLEDRTGRVLARLRFSAGKIDWESGTDDLRAAHLVRNRAARRGHELLLAAALELRGGLARQAPPEASPGPRPAVAGAGPERRALLE
jgi:hypothetical protein